PSDGRTGSCRGRRRFRWWSSLPPLRRSALPRRPSSSAPARQSPAAPPCARAARDGFPPDIACRRTDRGRSDLSEAYADTHSLKASRTDSGKQLNEFGADLVERQHRGADASIGRRTRHAPDHGAGFVLRDHSAAGGDDLLAAAHAVGTHAGEDQGKRRALPDVDGGGEPRIDRRFAEIDRRAVIERDLNVSAMTHHLHVAAARGKVEAAGPERLALA